MQVSIETTSGLERRLTVGVPAEHVDNRANERLKEAAKTIRINGFRKGKAPLKVIKRHYGEGVRQEILSDVINHSLQEAFVREDVQPAGQPHIEIKQFASGKDLEFTATFEVYPDVTLGEFDGYQIEKLSAEINSENIDNMINSLREQQASYHVVERVAKEGDKANINFLGTKDGEEFEGGKADGHDLELGSNSMIPGFEDGIVGMSAGESKVLSLTFPEDYHVKDLKGAAVEFQVTVNRVEEKVLPEVDAEFMKKFGEEHGDMDKFRADIEKNMNRELANAIKNKTKISVMDQLLENHTIELPNALMTSEIKALREQMIQQFGGMQQNKEMDLKSLLPDEMFHEKAERRVSLGLLIGEVIKVNDLKADSDKVRSTIEELAASYEQPHEVVNYYYNNPQLLSGIEASVLEDMVVELILEKATVTETVVSYEEAVKT
ncbi:trigger factor [Candidatus Endobugula sertula]|uniref:Trigger factor n=1 Tax=Candidatus Endobugula sertula TaxID=62101 RepID=A0A1D2QU59_9GAMM|nr:trigger factor [Candidatus Endobugula sertula]